MGKAKKLAAAALAVLALAGTGVAVNGGGEGVHLACQGGSGSAGCYG